MDILQPKQISKTLKKNSYTPIFVTCIALLSYHFEWKENLDGLKLCEKGK
jgi:hypothetical protein